MSRRTPSTLDPRDARTLQPNTPSCGNQPAHISMTARRTDTLRPTYPGPREAPPAITTGGASPCPLTREDYISEVDAPLGAAASPTTCQLPRSHRSRSAGGESVPAADRHWGQPSHVVADVSRP